jgi:hypothetical protein
MTLGSAVPRHDVGADEPHMRGPLIDILAGRRQLETDVECALARTITLVARIGKRR